MSIQNLLKVYLISCLQLLLTQVKAQETSNYQPNKVIGPSPTASSLGAYGDLAVSYYSGTPDISISLYDIKTPSHSLPIRMQYNASGIRVSEDASWVGLGWSLTAGGVITRTVRGFDDFETQGFYMADALPPATSDNNHDANSADWIQHKAYFDQIKAGKIDGEPDIFNFNFQNYSGKFIHGKQLDGSKVFMADQNNLKVEYKQNPSGWLITDANGYKFYFGTQEWTAEEYAYSSESQQIPDNAPLNYYNYNPGRDMTTAWYLDSIVAPTAEKMRFFYARNGHSFGLVSKSEKAYNEFYRSGECSNSTSSMKAEYTFYNASRSTVFDAYLDSIVFSNGSIKFTTTDREDIEDYPFIEPGKPAKLSAITIRDGSGKRIEKYLLEYSYFNSTSTSGRLKLDAITEFGQTDQIFKPPHKFSYFSPNDLPSKVDAYKIDHWGFYNGQNNKTLLPEMLFTEQISAPKFLSGSNRHGSTSIENLRNGVLESITYPTGGSTNFDYELHEYANLKGRDRFNDTTINAYTYSYPAFGQEHTYETFEVTDTTLVTFTYGYEKYDENANDMAGREVVYVTVDKQLPDSFKTPLIAFSNYTPCENSSDPNCDGSNGSVAMIIVPGKYFITLFSQPGYHVRAFASYIKKVPVKDGKRQGGGLRIKAITNYESGQKAKVRKFYYTDTEQPNGKCVGKLLSTPRYDYTFYNEENVWGCTHRSDYIARLSNSMYPIGFTSKGTIVGYDKVTEVIGENGEGGKTVYYYYNTEDYNVTNFPSVPTVSDPLNGKLAVMAVFDAAGNLLKKVDYNYQTKETTQLKGVKLYNEASFESNISYGNYLIKFYDNASDWNVLTSEEEKNYSDAGTFVTTKKLYYDNSFHKEVTRQEFLKTDGSTLITKYKYPSDYTTAGSSSFAAQMTLKNILSPVIEEQKLLKTGSTTKLIGGSFTEYQLFNNKFYKPSVIYQIETNQPLTDLTESTISTTNQITFHSRYKPKVYFDQYDALSGNLRVYYQANDVPQSYLWGYNNALLIAEAKNALYKDVFYNSFEELEGNSSIGDSRTGDKSRITGTTGYKKDLMGLTNGKYLLTYWSKESGDWILKTTPITITTGGYTISLSGQIDELRFYPEDAQMTTYTHTPQVGITSATDINNLTTFYLYDGFNRLTLVKDDKGNIVKTFKYHYKNNYSSNN